MQQQRLEDEIVELKKEIAKYKRELEREKIKNIRNKERTQNFVKLFNKVINEINTMWKEYTFEIKHLK